MINVSSDFKDQTKASVKQWHSFLTDYPGEVYEDKVSDDDDLKSLKITTNTNLLKTVMRQGEAVFFGSHDYLDKYIHPNIGIVLPDTTTEYIDYGSFLVKELIADKATGGTKITFYDKMFEALIPYDIDPIYELTFPCTIGDLLEAICTRLNWTLATGSDTFPNSDYEIQADPITGLGMTFRQVLDDIAEAAGSIIYFDIDDKITVKQIAHGSPVDELDKNFLSGLKVESKYGEINSVVLSRTPQEDNILDKDQTSIDTYGLTEIKIKDNVLVDDDRETAVTPILEELLGLWWYPVDGTSNGSVYFQPGDRITLTDNVDVERETIIWKIVIDLKGGIIETVHSDRADADSTNYNTAGIVGQQIKNTEIKVDKQKGEILILTGNLNEAVSSITLSISNITASVNEISSQQDIDGDNIADLQSDLAELQLTADALTLAIAGIGGTNLLKNSVGLKGSIAEWQILDDNGSPVNAANNGTVDQSTNVINNSESGSAINLLEQFIKQTFATIENETYTIYFRYKSNDTCLLKVTGLDNISLPASADWVVYKRQFLGSSSTTTVEFNNTAEGSGASFTITDAIVKLGDASGWVQAPNEVYGANYRFDKDGFYLTDPNSKFKALLTNEALTVFDTTSGSDKIVMQVSKDFGQILKLLVKSTFTLEREDNSASALRMIAVDDGAFLVIND